MSITAGPSLRSLRQGRAFFLRKKGRGLPQPAAGRGGRIPAGGHILRGGFSERKGAGGAFSGFCGSGMGLFRGRKGRAEGSEHPAFAEERQEGSIFLKKEVRKGFTKGRLLDTSLLLFAGISLQKKILLARSPVLR